MLDQFRAPGAGGDYSGETRRHGFEVHQPESFGERRHAKDITLGEELAHIAPALVIVAYGTNESGDSTTTPDDHEAAIRSLVARTRAPSAECLVLGPPDRGARTLGKLVEIIAAQRRAADAAGCAFYDQQGAMGGPNTIGRWAAESPRRAQHDFVHLTRAGYAVVGQALADDLIAAYENR